MSSSHSPGDLDVFLSLIESRLRADFTSPDLSRAIIAAGSTSGGLSSALPGGESSPSKFLSLLAQVLHKPAKPIKLRALMSVLGLDSDEVIERSASASSGGLSFGSAAGARQPDDNDEIESRKTDAIVWQLLQDAEKDGEMWVRVVAGIIKGIMFTTNRRDVDRHCDPACRGETAKQELDKITTEILEKVVESSSMASSKLLKLEQKLQPSLDDDDEDDEDDEMQEQQKKQNDRFIETCQIRQDVDCTFAPDKYSLLSPSAIGQIIPEASTNFHFTCNMEARVLKIDEEVEKKRAEEEGKELHVQSIQAKSNPAGRLGGVTARSGANSTGGALLAGRMRGRFSSAGRAAGRTGADRGASLFRPSNNVSGRGRGLAGRGRVAGRVAGRAGALPGRGGATAGRLHRRVPRAMLAGRGRGSSSVTASSSASGESKMKMIELSEVEGLKTRDKEREQKNTVQARKLERKRKLLEEARSTGLSRNSRDTKKTRVEEVPPSNTATAPPQQHGQQQKSPDDSWQALLSKSNQLANIDREAIHEFFNARKMALPIDQHDDANDDGIWKVKLNEEKTIDEQTGEQVKETLYLELDYGSFSFKRTRKVKRK